MTTYGAAGVPWAWLVDPDQQMLEACWNDQGVWRHAGRWAANDLVRAQPFQDIEFPLDALCPRT